MYFVVIGVLLLVMKVAEFGVVAEWSWWGILSPFAAAVVWWAWADATGYTKARQAEREDRRVAARRERHLDNMGLSFKRRGSTPGKARLPTDNNKR